MCFHRWFTRSRPETLHLSFELGVWRGEGTDVLQLWFATSQPQRLKSRSGSGFWLLVTPCALVGSMGLPLNVGTVTCRRNPGCSGQQADQCCCNCCGVYARRAAVAAVAAVTVVVFGCCWFYSAAAATHSAAQCIVLLLLLHCTALFRGNSGSNATIARWFSNSLLAHRTVRCESRRS